MKYNNFVAWRKEMLGNNIFCSTLIFLWTVIEIALDKIYVYLILPKFCKFRDAFNLGENIANQAGHNRKNACQYTEFGIDSGTEIAHAKSYKKANANGYIANLIRREKIEGELRPAFRREERKRGRKSPRALGLEKRKGQPDLSKKRTPSYR